MKKLVFVRHGESLWNKENKFTGWTDIDLTPRGIEQARAAGKLLKENGIVFDKAFSSFLVRATNTLDLILSELKQKEIPISYAWRLNERHYGALQGLDKTDTLEKYGEEKFKQWRRSFDVPPPELSMDDPRFSGNDPKYKDVPKEELPKTEALKDVIARVQPYWEKEIKPELQKNRTILISAHGNTLRAMKMILDHMTPEQVLELNIPYAVPFVYEFDDNMNVTKSYMLGDEEEIKKATQEIADQGKKKSS
jgi:2,3-bisphosphoglycerate-dependent phosphoglycerate mutase